VVMPLAAARGAALPSVATIAARLAALLHVQPAAQVQP
jgi:formylmethanofuran dehydrogenase subunit B